MNVPPSPINHQTTRRKRRPDASRPPHSLPHHHHRRVARCVGCIWSFCPGVHPILYPAFNNGNLARIPRGFLIGSAWVKPTSLPGHFYWPQGEMLWIRLDWGITLAMPWILCLTLQIYPISGLDWSDIAQEAGSYPCHPALDALKPLLRIGLPNTTTGCSFCLHGSGCWRNLTRSVSTPMPWSLC
jgi:hypothetical protein